MLEGYVLFLLLLFLPGIAFLELFKVGVGSSLAQKLGLSFGLSISLDALLLILRTSHLPLGGVLLDGIFANTLYLMLGCSGIALVFPALYRRRFYFYVRPSKSDALVILLVLVQAALVYLHFLKYPIFPQFASGDFTQHVGLVSGLQNGQLKSIPEGILYYGVHTMMAALLALTGGIPLVVTQRTMGILVIASPILVYSAVNFMSESKPTSLLATGVYVGSGFVWFGSVFNAGLFPNFFGILSALFILIAVSEVLNRPRDAASWAIYILAVANAYFSHYSTLLIVPALASLPVLGFVFARKVHWASIGAASFLLVPVIAVALLDPSVVNTLFTFISAQGTPSVAQDTTLSSLLMWSPFLRYVTAEITSDTATVSLLIMATMGAYFTAKQRNPLRWLPLVWLVSIAVAAPASAVVWRFAYVALVPLTVMASVGLAVLLPQRRAVAPVRRKGRRSSIQSRRRLVLVGIALVLMSAGSWSTLLLEDAGPNPQIYGQAQYDVLRSMLWLAAHTPPGSKLISVTDSTYNVYMPLINGRSAAYSPLIDPDGVIVQAAGQKDVYVALTRVATVSISRADFDSLLSSYQEDPRFKLAYANSNVLVYSVNSSG